MKSIVNPNTSGQGTCPDYASGNQYLVPVILRHGWSYSHSVPVTFPSGGKLCHCFKLGEHNVSFFDGESAWQTSTSCASGRSHTGNGSLALDKHLKDKVKRYKLKMKLVTDTLYNLDGTPVIFREESNGFARVDHLPGSGNSSSHIKTEWVEIENLSFLS